MAENKEILELTKKLMRFKTTEASPNELERCMDFIEGYFSDHDVQIRRFDKDKKPSMVISLGRSKHPELFLVGHIDVVPAKDKLFIPRVKAGKLYGRGSYDDKSSVALMMVLLKKLSLMEEMPDVALMITSDEETGGKAGAKLLLEKYTSNFAVVLDGGTSMSIVTKEKGALHLKLTAEGRNAHGSTPWEGENALDKLIHFYQELRKRFPSQPQSEKVWVNTLSLGAIHGGQAANQVPDHAEMSLDMRFVSDSDKDQILRFINQAKGIKVEVLSNAGFLDTDNNNRYVKELGKAASKIVGAKVSLSREAGASDARFFADKNIPSVLLWPVGHHAHAEGEYVDIKSINKLYFILQYFALNSLRKAS